MPKTTLCVNICAGAELVPALGLEDGSAEVCAGAEGRQPT